MTISEGVERRVKPRIDRPFPATVRGMDAGGEAFEINTVLDNLSADGLYLRLRQRVQPGTVLSIIIRLSSAPMNGVHAPRIAIDGVVLRAELKPDGTCGIAIKLTHHRFL